MDNIRRICTGNYRDEVVVKKVNDDHSPDVICPHVDIAKKYAISNTGDDLAYQHDEALFR